MADNEPKKMKPKMATAKKRFIQSQKRREVNKAARSQVKSQLRSLREIIQKRDAEQGQQSLQKVYSLLDKAAKKGLVKPNKASRLKSRLSAQLHAMS